MSWGQEFLETFLGRLQRQDVGELMHDYHEDAELVAFDFVLKGKDAIGQYFTKGLINRSGKIFRHIALTLPPEKDKKICERI